MTSKPAWTGWITFAGVMLALTGTVNLVQGIVALVEDKYVVLVADSLYLVDVTGWGWALLVAGLLLVAASLGLFSGQTWARVAAIVVVAVHSVVQVLWIGAYPVWSLLMIALGVVVLYALTARWPAPDIAAEPQHRSEPTVRATPAPAPAPDGRTPVR